MSGHRLAITLGLLCLLAAVPACEPTGDAPTPEPPAVSTSATSGPATIALDVDSSDVRTVDRVTVTITASAEEGVHLTPPVFDPTTTGWTVVSRVDAPLDANDAGTVRRASVVLEPFLDGEYEIPPATVSWSRADGTAGTIASEPITVRVRSVLDGEHASQLAAARGLAEPPPPGVERRGFLGYVLVGTAAILALIGVAGWLARRRAPRMVETPTERLARLRDDPRAEADELCAAVAEALHTGGDRSGAAHALLDEAERARYGRAPMTPDRARAMAASTLALLSGTPGRGPA